MNYEVENINLKEIIKKAKKWSTIEQLEFCSRISQNVTIGIRSILSYKKEKNIDKLKSIKYLNEFHHRINNLRFEIERIENSASIIEGIGKNAKNYASMHYLTKGEITAIIKSSYDSIIRKTNTQTAS